MKHSTKTRVLSMLLAVMMVLSLFPMAAMAEEGAAAAAEAEAAEAILEEEVLEEEAAVATYTVNHSILDFEADVFVLQETETLVGIAGELTDAQAKDYEGCILFDEIVQTEIAADGSTVVDVYYIELLEEAGVYAKTPLYDTSVSNEYFKVISADTYTLAPGAQEHEIILNNAAGSDRKAVHVIEVDPTATQVEVIPGYYGIDQFDPTNSATWSTAGVTELVAYYENVLGYNVVGAMNTALSYDATSPYGFMVYNGQVISTPELHAGAQTYLAVTKNDDGTVTFDLRSTSEGLTGNEWQAISANFGWLVQNGKMTNTSGNRTDSDASRSMLGIKADGTLIICQVDGRNAPTSSGLSSYEMSEMMLALGCVWAVNGDGGGSSTFVTKREGTDANVMRSNPSDGYERPTINSIVVISKAIKDGKFHHAVVNAETKYVTPGSEVAFTASGVDSGGGPADLPADLSWQLADSTMGTVANGVFTSNGTLGTAVVQMVYNGEVVGEDTVEVINPTEIKFEQAAYVVPYGKSVKINVKATISDGLIEITTKPTDFTVTLDNTAVGTLDGNTFTAVSEANGVEAAALTAVYAYDNTMVTTASLQLGRGSEVLEDYESYAIGEQIYTYTNSHGYGEGDSCVEVVDASTGKVRNGEKALAIHVDGTEYRYYGTFSQNKILDLGKVGVDGAKATAMGAWIYIPEEAIGLHFAIRAVDDAGKTLFTQYLTPNQEYTGTLELPGWFYLSVDMTAVNYSFNLGSFQLFMYEQDGGNYDEVDLTTATNLLGKYTIYVDDITIDFSSAVEDREIPEFDDIYISNDDTGVLMNGQTVNTATIGAYVQARDHAADNAVGLNRSSAKAFVDGVQITDGFTVSANGLLSIANVNLADGAHVFRFEIADANGNTASIQRHVIVDAAGKAPAVSIVPQDPDATDLLVGSTYWIDVKAAAVENIDTMVTTVELDGSSDWVLDFMKVTPGFTVDSVLDKNTNDVTLTITKTGPVSGTGEGVLVSIPIHVWEYETYYNNKTAVDLATGKVDWSVQNSWLRAVKLQADYGVVTYTDETSETFAVAPFAANIEVSKGGDGWHIHKAQAVEDKAPTCTEVGYTGRTVCVGCLCGLDAHSNGAACPTDGCGSVVDWGTPIPVSGHTYEVVGDQLACTCGDTLTSSGLVNVNGKIYCLIAGALVTGWQNVDNKWCYASKSTKVVQTGEFTVSGNTYTADENGYVIKGAWITDANGTKYSFGPSVYTREWAEIEGEKYYFGTDSYIYTGLRFIPVNRNNDKEGYRVYTFAEDGKLVDEMLDANGIIKSDIDGMFYVVNGLSYYGGLMKVGCAYYYARSSGKLVVDSSYWITKTNDLMPEARYSFDAEGKMIDPPAAVHTEADPVHENVVEATADATGSYDKVVYCADCGEELSRETVTLDKLASFVGVTTNLGNELAMKFGFRKSSLNADLLAAGDYYAVITKTNATDGSTKTLTIPMSQWDTSAAVYTFNYPGVSAKEMNDTLTGQIFTSDGYAASVVREACIADYALGQMSSTSTLLRSTIVDMLNYGAAAQEYFGYDTENMANAGLTAEQQELYATKEVTAVDSRVQGDNYMGSTLNLGANLAIKFAFKNLSASKIKGMYAIATFTSFRGEAKEQRFESSDFDKVSSSAYSVTVNTISVGDVSTLVTVTFYNADGSVFGTATDSVESYIARQTKPAIVAVGTAILKFGASAKAYFLSKT